MHWAAWNGHVAVINILVSTNRCHTNTQDKSGSNALHCAALNGHAHTIGRLVTAKCDSDLQRKDGWTPLHLASWNGHHDVVHALIESNCKVNARTEDGMGALHLAAVKGHDEIAQEFLDSGIAPDMQDKNGNTAIHEAARWNQTSTVRVLMQSGCRINMKNNEGDNPMKIARKDGYNDVVAELSGLAMALRNSEEITEGSDIKNIMLHNKSTSEFDGKKQNTDFLSVNSWEKTLEKTRAEVIAKYESRIAEVEKQHKKKIDMIERQCSQRLRSVNRVLSTYDHRSNSAPDCHQLVELPCQFLSIHRTESMR